MDASITTAKAALKQEIGRLTGILGHLNATLSYLDTLSPTELAGLTAGVQLVSSLPATPAASSASNAIVAAPAQAPASVPAPTAPVAVVSPPAVAAPVAPAAPVATAASKYSSPPPKPPTAEAAQQLHHDVDAWMPKLTRVSLPDLYLVATLDRPKHLPQLPSSLDMDNPEVRRVIGNYLRHSEVIGYRDFCARLKAFTGLSHLYKRVRDKATAAINTAYPELAGGTYTFPAEGQKMAPSGATQFAALATLLPVPAPAVTASA
jgi:hypothetical protein